MSKFQKLQGKALKFAAHLVSKRPEDQQRAFVITFYLADDTVGVFEKRGRNTGIVAGKFLERSRLKTVTGRLFKPSDFLVGSAVTINSYRFLIDGVDSFTRAYLSDAGLCEDTEAAGAIVSRLVERSEYKPYSQESSKELTETSFVHATCPLLFSSSILSGSILFLSSLLFSSLLFSLLPLYLHSVGALLFARVEQDQG